MKKSIIAVCIILFVSIISTICFGVTMGTGALKTYIDNGNLDISNLIENKFALNDRDWDSESQQNLRLTQGMDFSQEELQDSFTVIADVAKINIIPSNDDDLHIKMNVYSKSTNYNENKYSLAQHSANSIEISCDENYNDKSIAVVTVEVPEDKIDTLSINVSVGDVRVSDIDIDTLNVNVSVGNLEVSNSNVEKAGLILETGDINLINNFNYSQELKASVNVGEIELDLPVGSAFSATYKVSIGDFDFAKENYSDLLTHQTTNVSQDIASQGRIDYKTNDNDEIVKINLECVVGNITIK